MKSPTPSARPAAAADTPKVTGLRVALTAAFFTGHPLHAQIGEYAQLQRELGNELERLNGQGWSVDPWHHAREGTYHSGGGFTNMLPLVLARRDGPTMLARTQAALHDRPAAEHAWLAEQTQNARLTPASVRVDVYDLGVAVINATFETQLPADASLQATARAFDSVAQLRPDARSGVRSPLAAAIQDLAHETARQFAAAAALKAPHALQDPWLSRFLDGQNEQDNDMQRPEWGRLLWLHPVHILEANDPDENLAAAAAALAPPFCRTIDIPDGRFVPGIGWSALVTRPGAGSSAAMPMRLTELHWAYYALYMEIDRGLLALLDRDRPDQSRSLAELEQDADDAFGDYMRVMQARARLDSALASLGGDELAVWEVIADVQKFDALIDAVERKLDALQRIAERRVQQAAASRARRTSHILSSLTALTVVTVAVALIGSFLGSRSDALGHIELRAIIVALALAVSIGVYHEAHRDSVRRARRR